MNKVLNINLGGYPLTIDDDAYEYMKAYLDNIRMRFHESEGREEIMRDIEMRLGELLTAELGSRRIIMLPDVEEVVRIMGKPEDYGGEPSSAGTGTGTGTRSKKSAPKSSDSAFPFGIKPGRRLFRDQENKIAGGVCAGFAAYLGIDDPLWVRLAFIVLTFISQGFWVPAYLIFWAVIPEAKTTADRLAMRGEPINVDNIAKEIEEGFGNLKNQMGAMGEAAVQDGRNTEGKLNKALADIVGFIGAAFAWVVRFFGKFGIALLVLAAIALVFTLLTTWIGGIWAFFTALPVMPFFSPLSTGVNYLGAFNVFLLVAIPIVGLLLTLLRVLFKLQTPGWVAFGLGALWFVNMISIFFVGTSAIQHFSEESTVEKEVSLAGLPSDTLRVVSSSASVDVNISDGRLKFEEKSENGVRDNRFTNQVDIRVVKSRTNTFRLIQTVSARGKSNNEAYEFADNLEFPITLTGNTLFVPKSFELRADQPWRNQKVRLTLEMPVGKSVTFDEHIYERAKAEMDVYANSQNRQFMSRNPGKIFTMTERGLICADCSQFGDEQYSGYEDYEHFIINGPVDAEIRKGEHFSVDVAKEDKNRMKVIPTGDRITFEAKADEAAVPVTIHTPVFTSMIVEGRGRITLRGFDEHRASIIAKGEPTVKAYMDCDNLDLNLQGPCKIELNGKGEYLNANLADGALLDAFGWKLDHAKVSLSGQSTAKLFVDQDDAEIRKDDSSVVRLQ